MGLHIGELIKKEVERKRLTYKEFGALIHRNEKTIPDIYDRESMSLDLLITISDALKKDFLCPFYNEEPMKSLRDDEISSLKCKLQQCTGQIEKLLDENNKLKELLEVTQELKATQKDVITLSREQIESYKLKLSVLNDSELKDHLKITG